ncbi:MAG: plasmid pRiA4b ORF-3 family protein [Prevotellaceae bacterium]|jgi:hypothetical protein|nr:plasmid pRiA4b ORF-3 family protein [Prevotellaceae bacterium]
MLYQFKIKLKGITHPPVWRRLLVPTTFSFYGFHLAIQEAFGWGDYHSFEFRERVYNADFRISLTKEVGWFYEDTMDARKTKLNKVFNSRSKLLYVYDFGDDWVHEIALEATLKDKGTEADCIAGKGACPPEDCGGIYGYAQLKETFEKDPNGEEAKNYREWLGLEEGENWNPNKINFGGYGWVLDE